MKEGRGGGGERRRDSGVSDHNGGSDVGLQQVDHLHGSLQAPLRAVGQHDFLRVVARGLEACYLHLEDPNRELQQLSWDLPYPSRKCWIEIPGVYFGIRYGIFTSTQLMVSHLSAFSTGLCRYKLSLMQVCY